MRFLGIAVLLIGCAEVEAEPKPPATGGIQGKVMFYRTAGTPNGSDSEGPKACTFEVKRGGRTISVKNNAAGKYKQALLPGRYELSFAKCIEGCGRVEPPPSTVDVTAGKFTTINVQCTVFGK